MIISASRRTDIPAFYSEWFFQRLHEGYVCVRNPMNIHQISKISLAPEIVDGIVFWTKNPLPMMHRLGELKDYMFYFQFSLNPYGIDLEKNVPLKNDVIIPTFQKLSQSIGKERVIWRYDPIIITSKYSLDYHIEYFDRIAKRLSGYTEKCIISFVDIYKNIRRNVMSHGVREIRRDEMLLLSEKLSEICKRQGIMLESCAEEIDLERFGISHGHCIDGSLFERLLACRLNLTKDTNQRTECGCASSIDIGAYNTCRNGCLYCYANYREKTVRQNCAAHDPMSPLLYGSIGENDIVHIREVKSCRNCQLVLFD